jgi:hypothetical protein
METIRKEPARYLLEYLMLTPDDVRIAAVARFTEGSDKLRQRIEERRARDANESLAMRRISRRLAPFAIRSPRQRGRHGQTVILPVLGLPMARIICWPVCAQPLHHPAARSFALSSDYKSAGLSREEC